MQRKIRKVSLKDLNIIRSSKGMRQNWTDMERKLGKANEYMKYSGGDMDTYLNSARRMKGNTPYQKLKFLLANTEGVDAATPDEIKQLGG